MSVSVCSGMSENGHPGQICLNARSAFRTVRKELGGGLVREGVSLGVGFKALPGPVPVSLLVAQNANS